jgi:hypothetical protein
MEALCTCEALVYGVINQQTYQALSSDKIPAKYRQLAALETPAYVIIKLLLLDYASSFFTSIRRR